MQKMVDQDRDFHFVFNMSLHAPKLQEMLMQLKEMLISEER